MTQPWRKATEPFVMMVLACWLALSPASAAPGPRTLLVMGDSLSAAYGIPPSAGWVALLAERLHDQNWTVVNASVSGETTAGGASRIDAALRLHSPALVLIALGANDGLRGLPLELAQTNLERMIRASRAAGADVILVGMQIPPNYGPDYTQQFQAMYRALAQRFSLPLLPFLLEPIARERESFLPDQLHPSADAQPRLLEHVWPLVAAAIAQD